MTGPAPQDRWLLVSDIDDTLTGDDGALHDLADSLSRNRDRLFVALNSSRPSGSVAETIATVFPRNFPIDAIITALGTEIVLGEARLDDWASRFDGWPARQIHQIVAALGHRAHDAMFQTPFKVSFAVPAEARSAVSEAIAAENLPCRTIASGQSDFDIIPPGAGKDAAALFLAERLGVGRDRLIVAGDSGNDLAMFAVAARAIAVGNARAELISSMPIYHSYHARNWHAAGVDEGLVHFGVLPG